MTFVNGDWKTKLSYLVMGFGNIARGQVLRGLLFLLFEVVFIGYMVLAGVYWMSMLPSLGFIGPHKEYHELLDTYVTVYGDNSFKILLYGVLTMFFIVGFIFTWRLNIKQNKIAEEILRSGKKLKSGKQDLRSLVDDQFHKTLLALPLTGILIFTVMPLVFMILVAFTNYDGTHDGFSNNLFTWVGLENFNTMLHWSGGGSTNYAATFGEVLSWTLMWAFFATFTNYFLGMAVAMMINKKGIRLKKVWRTILVTTIAIPQFISLLYVSKMFAKNGIINGILMDLGWITKALPFWEDPTWARITVIAINVWIGIPYLMLIATGILMNIPADLYESAKIDGASGWQQYSKITLPYMLFVTGPYLLTSFTGNINNFNVIFLLTGGAPTNINASGAAGSVGYTDLLITWLFKITTGAESKYYLASVIGILVFVIMAIFTLVVYGVLPSIKNEEDFQ
ncbi:MAG: ABC transporter permease subunit [Clostridia bacterium]|nr:ABC transporter permease subunit [Clostridia bacterium]